jgi:hypothetical protein
MKYKPTGYDRKKEGSDEYKQYFQKAIEKLTKDGHSLPLVKKPTGLGYLFQMRGHQWLADDLKGYWERNVKSYQYRARVDYRALYLGAIILFKEEEVLKGVDNSEVICALEAHCEHRKLEHIEYKKMIMAREEIIAMLVEVDAKMKTPENFDNDVERLINTIPAGEYRNIFAKKVDEMIEEESQKLKNRKYQAKHRYFEQLTKGMRIVEG